MKYSILTDKGVVREMNQDSCFLTLFDDNTCFAVVCDGMGGPNAGEIASDIAIKNISERFAAGWRKGMSVDSVKNLLLTSISAANICVYDEAKSDSRLSGMGTTAVAAVYNGTALVTAHVGDSRAYYCNNELVQVTKDHSLVQEMFDAGTLTIEIFPLAYSKSTLLNPAHLKQTSFTPYSISLSITSLLITSLTKTITASNPQASPTVSIVNLVSKNLASILLFLMYFSKLGISYCFVSKKATFIILFISFLIL